MPTLHDIATKLDGEGIDYGIVNGYADDCSDSKEFARLVRDLKPLLQRANDMVMPCIEGLCTCQVGSG